MCLEHCRRSQTQINIVSSVVERNGHVSINSVSTTLGTVPTTIFLHNAFETSDSLLNKAGHPRLPQPSGTLAAHFNCFAHVQNHKFPFFPWPLGVWVPLSASRSARRHRKAPVRAFCDEGGESKRLGVLFLNVPCWGLVRETKAKPSRLRVPLF